MIDYHAAENEQRAKQTYRGRTHRSASDASTNAASIATYRSPTNTNANNNILRRHSDTRYTTMSSASSLSSLSSLSTHHSHHHHPSSLHHHHHHPYANTAHHHSTNLSTATTPHLSHQLPTPDYYNYYYNYNNSYSKTPTNNYANVQHHSSCHLYNGNDLQQHPYSANTNATNTTTNTNTTTPPTSSSSSNSSLSSSNNDRPLSPTPSNLFPPELSVTLSSVTSPHSSLSDDHLGSPLPQHFNTTSTSTNIDQLSDDDDNKPRKRSKCDQQQHKSIFETDSSNLHWSALA